MNILSVHNRYLHRGGEDSAREAEIRLLRDRGDTVVEYCRSNQEIEREGLRAKLGLAAGAIWSRRSYQEMRSILRSERPDVAHFHNVQPLISPSAYYACNDLGVPVVQTLHNYRLLCPGAYFLRDGEICEACFGKPLPIAAITHGCYKGSRMATATVAATNVLHRVRGTWDRRIASYIALTDFARTKFIAAGFPPDRIFVKPNAVYPEPLPRRGMGEFALYLGRLSQEKGVHILAKSWHSLSGPVPLRVAGDGPLRAEVERTVRAAVSRSQDILFYGAVSNGEALALLRSARFLVAPSICYEVFPMAVAEAFAAGVPVIASNIGALAEMVRDGVTGCLVHPNDPEDLSKKVLWAWNHPEELSRMGGAAQAEFQEKYSASANYGKLIDIYQRAVHGTSGMCQCG